MSDSNSGWIKSTCAYCGVGCGIEARPTALGKLEVRGDKEHPSNYGKLCTKGIALGETVTPLGRLTQPTHIKNQQNTNSYGMTPLNWSLIGLTKPLKSLVLIQLRSMSLANC